MKKILFAVFTAVCVFTCVSCSKDNDTLLEDIKIPEDTTTVKETAEESLNAKMMSNSWEDIENDTIKIKVSYLYIYHYELHTSIKAYSYYCDSNNFKLKISVNGSEFYNISNNFPSTIRDENLGKDDLLLIIGVFDSNNNIICTKSFKSYYDYDDFLGTWLKVDKGYKSVIEDGKVVNTYYEEISEYKINHYCQGFNYNFITTQEIFDNGYRPGDFKFEYVAYQKGENYIKWIDAFNEEYFVTKEVIEGKNCLKFTHGDESFILIRKEDYQAEISTGIHQVTL